MRMSIVRNPKKEGTFMEIRSDFQLAAPLLSRLIEYSKVFEENNFEHWPHLKCKEDYDKVYNLEPDYKRAFEEIYNCGREIAGFMSSALVAFNEPREFPTLKSFVDYFTGGWVDQIEIFKKMSKVAKNKYSDLNSRLWAVSQMIILFDKQLELLVSIKKTIEGIKDNVIYKWENGDSQPPYSEILEHIHRIGKCLEKYPRTYTDMDEESLRDKILVSLNSALPLVVTGETLNKKGKTDILVRNIDSNEFIGECKFWHGKKAFLKTISQLLGYLTWRDTKTAIILFVSNADFTSVIENMKTIVPEHPNYSKLIEEKDETWFDYEFKMDEDKMRIVKIAIMLFHFPQSPLNS